MIAGFNISAKKDGAAISDIDKANKAADDQAMKQTIINIGSIAKSDAAISDIASAIFKISAKDNENLNLYSDKETLDMVKNLASNAKGDKAKGAVAGLIVHMMQNEKTANIFSNDKKLIGTLEGWQNNPQNNLQEKRVAINSGLTLSLISDYIKYNAPSVSRQNSVSATKALPKPNVWQEIVKGRREEAAAARNSDGRGQ